MPRDDQPTPLRRFMMQGIMWLILGATIGAAALVDHLKEAGLHPSLAERVELNGVTFNLPSGWTNLDHEVENDQIMRGDPRLGDLVLVSVRQMGFDEVFGQTQRAPGARPVFLDEIPLGEFTGRLVFDRVKISGVDDVPALVVSGRIPQARSLEIAVMAPSARDREDVNREIDLIKRIAESVKVDPKY